MKSKEIRQKFLKFFEERGHKIVPSSSLIPDDPSVLLTTAGMQQFKKYYTDPSLAPAKNVASIQKCFRTSDIDEVGDESHLTFFEMLGSFSFGGYWKKEAIEYAHEFLTKELGLEISYVTVFKGSGSVAEDKESKKIWKSLGVSDIREEGMKDVFWGPTGTSGPCGPTTEIYCKNADGKDVEIWNIVFNEFFCHYSREALLAGEAKLEPLETKGIDTGMGFERLAMVVQKKKNIFETDLFDLVMQKIREYATSDDVVAMRIVADHIRASTFLIADGIRPSNTDRGYILRRLLRRAKYYYDSIGAHNKALGYFASFVADVYKETDYRLNEKISDIDNVITDEEMTFVGHLMFGKRLLEKIIKNDGRISGENAFLLYATYGYPFELILDIARENKVEVDVLGFQEKKKTHQEISRAGAEKKFGGHGLLLNTGELKAKDEEELKKVTRLHTATHLLQAALRKVLGDEVKQMGSDITVERTRFDFSFSKKLTDEELKKVEDWVNDKVEKKLPMNIVMLPIEEAKKTGALFFFKEKYPEKVNVYFVGDSLENAVSKEFCGGPHVKNTSEIGHFKILKSESIGASTRRIRATVE